MATLTEIEILHDADDGIAEALRRDAELEANSTSAISLEQLDAQIENRSSRCG